MKLSKYSANGNDVSHTIVDGKSAKAMFDLSVFANVPDEIKQELTPSFVERTLREAGLSRSEAKALLARGWQAMTGNEVKAADKLLATLRGANETKNGTRR